MLALFLVAERRAEEPILPLELFRNRAFVVAGVIVFLVGGGMFGAITMLPVFLQGVQGIPATNAGTLMMPMMLAVTVAAATNGQIMTRTGRYKVLVIVSSVTLLVGMLLSSRVDAETSRLTTVRNMIVAGIGLGLSMPACTVIVQNALPFQVIGVATASVTCFRQIGGTVGVALFTGVMISRVRDGLAEAGQGLPPVVQKPARVAQ